jgi:hypothetical protein
MADMRALTRLNSKNQGRAESAFGAVNEGRQSTMCSLSAMTKDRAS